MTETTEWLEWIIINLVGVILIPAYLIYRYQWLSIGLIPLYFVIMFTLAKYTNMKLSVGMP